MAEKYSVYSDFDLEKHKQTYIDYFEVLLLRNGKVVYTVPSHQEKAIELAMKELNLSRSEVVRMCPIERQFDYLNWLLSLTGSAALWNNDVLAPSPLNRAQIATLKKLKIGGVYKGRIPM